MKREEEIKRYCAEQGFPYGSVKAAIATKAIKWADRTMIEKAVEWLKDNISKRAINIGTDDEFKIMIGSKTWDEFRRAMEE